MPHRFPGGFPAAPTQQDVAGFCTAARENNTETVEAYLDRFGKAIIDGRDSNQDTALSWASWMGHIETVQLLVERGADINARGMSDRTPLGWAAKGSRSEVVTFLLTKGPDVSLRDEDGKTPAELAEEAGRAPMAQLIRQEGAKRSKAIAEEAAQKKAETDGKSLAAKRLELLKNRKNPKLKL